MKILLSIISVSFFLSFLISPAESPYQPPPYDKAVNALMKRASTRLAKRHNMNLVGIKEGMMDCIRKMGFRFQIFRKLEKNEARAILVDCIEDFLKDINQDESIRQYLEVYPFDIHHVDVIIFISIIKTIIIFYCNNYIIM